MKTINVKFTDLPSELDIENNYIVRLLKKHYNLNFTDEPDFLFYLDMTTKTIKTNSVFVFSWVASHWSLISMTVTMPWDMLQFNSQIAICRSLHFLPALLSVGYLEICRILVQ